MSLPIDAALALDYLHETNNSRCGLKVAQLNRVVLNDGPFALSPGGSEHHHNYKHGLVIHTAEVMANAVNMSHYTLKAGQLEVLVTAVIWHDFMKTRDYSLAKDETITKEPYRKLINHVSGSFGHFFTNFSPEAFENVDLVDRVSHCLLSHHGSREWGSPVEPQTAEAFILHTADMMSAHGIVL